MICRCSREVCQVASVKLAVVCQSILVDGMHLTFGIAVCKDESKLVIFATGVVNTLLSVVADGLW